MKAGTLPPGPKGRPLRGFLPEFRKDPLGLLTQVAHQWGDVVRLRLGPIDFLLLSDPDSIEQVLVTQNKLFLKGRGLEAAEHVLGQGLLTSEGDFWRRQRRLAQPAFHRSRIVEYGRTMVDFAEQHAAGWQSGATYDIAREMMRVTLAIAAKTLFSFDVTTEADAVGDALSVTMEHFKDRTRRLIKLPESWPLPGNIRARRAAEQLDSVIYKIIEERRASGEDTGDLLSMLMHAVDEDGSQMTPKQLRDEAMTLFLAGHETTANNMAWTWYLLAQNPAAEARLHAELDRVLGGRAPTPEDLPNLPYTQAVIDESLRLYPPAWILGRLAAAPVRIGEYEFPAGTQVLMSQWVMHRHPRYFEDPLAFRPERWLDGLVKRLPAYAYFPFGGGPRICIGKPFALMEAGLLLAAIGRNWQFRLVAGHPVELEPVITLRPRHGIKVTAIARQ